MQTAYLTDISMGNASGRLSGVPSLSQVDAVTENYVLLLGCGDSGKTTLFNQWRLECERKNMSRPMPGSKSSQISGAIKEVFESLLKYYEREKGALDGVVDPKLKPALSRWSSFPMPVDLASMLRGLLGVKEINTFIKEYMDETSASRKLQYFQENLSRFCAEGYSPSDLDLMYTFSRTTGVIQESIRYKLNKINVCDFGGQRNERRKWAMFYRQADVIVFTVSLTEFDQTLYEQDEENRLEESLATWRAVVEDVELADCTFILVFTKPDLYESKMHRLIGEGKNLAAMFPASMNMQALKDQSPKGLQDEVIRRFEDIGDSAQRFYTYKANLLDFEQVRPIITQVLDALNVKSPN